MLPERAVDAREPAQLISADEFNNLDPEIKREPEDDNDNGAVLSLSQTGAALNRVLVAGTLTEVKDVSNESSDEPYLRGRIAGPTGNFFVYAGQYQDEARTFLQNAEAPEFVMSLGKINMYRPEDDVMPQVRPEWIKSISGDVRDQWVIDMAHETMDRIEITLNDSAEMPNDVPAQIFEDKGINLDEEDVKAPLDPVIEAVESVDSTQFESEESTTEESPAKVKA